MSTRHKPTKPYIVLDENPVICLHRGVEDLTCFGKANRQNWVHLDCAEAHFGSPLAWRTKPDEEYAAELRDAAI
jgi:hypothetical protein